MLAPVIDGKRAEAAQASYDFPIFYGKTDPQLQELDSTLRFLQYPELSRDGKKVISPTGSHSTSKEK